MTEKTVLFNTAEEKDWLLGVLRDGNVKITFTKKDGSERIMTCTLSESKIPAEFTPKGTEKTRSDTVLPVFDVEKQGWRSFRFDSIKAIELSLSGE